MSKKRIQEEPKDELDESFKEITDTMGDVFQVLKKKKAKIQDLKGKIAFYEFITKEYNICEYHGLFHKSEAENKWCKQCNNCLACCAELECPVDCGVCTKRTRREYRCSHNRCGACAAGLCGCTECVECQCLFDPKQICEHKHCGNCRQFCGQCYEERQTKEKLQ